MRLKSYRSRQWGWGTIEALRLNRPQLVRLRRLWVRLGEHPPPLE